MPSKIAASACLGHDFFRVCQSCRPELQRKVAWISANRALSGGRFMGDEAGVSKVLDGLALGVYSLGSDVIEVRDGTT